MRIPERTEAIAPAYYQRSIKKNCYKIVSNPYFVKMSEMEEPTQFIYWLRLVKVLSIAACSLEGFSQDAGFILPYFTSCDFCGQ